MYKAKSDKNTNGDATQTHNDRFVCLTNNKPNNKPNNNNPNTNTENRFTCLKPSNTKSNKSNEQSWSEKRNNTSKTFSLNNNEFPELCSLSKNQSILQKSAQNSNQDNYAGLFYKTSKHESSSSNSLNSDPAKQEIESIIESRNNMYKNKFFMIHANFLNVKSDNYSDYSDLEDLGVVADIDSSEYHEYISDDDDDDGSDNDY
jgi:hypothetical protein